MGMSYKTDPDGPNLPVGPGKSSDRTLGEKALWTLHDPFNYRTRKTPLPDGGMMMVRTKGGMPEITATKKPVEPETMYMESGAYSQTPPDFTGTIIVRKTEPVALLEAKTLTPLYSKKPPIDGGVSKAYSKQDNGQIGMAMAAVAPSNFSGMMRRLAQGRFGSGKPEMAIDEVAIGFEFQRTSGVVRFGKVYWLVNIDCADRVATVRVWPLRIGSNYRAAMEGKIDLEFEAREILALSAATVNVDAEKIVAAFDIPDGTPLAYGWQFNSTGSRADIVIRYPSGNPLTDTNTWSHLCIEFTRTMDGDKEAIACSYSMLEQTEVQMVGGMSPIWVPFNGYTMWINQQMGDFEGSSAGPLYCYYHGDDLHVVRWSYTMTDIPFDSAERQRLQDQAMWSSSVYPVGSGSGSIDYEYGKSYSFGMSDGISNNYWSGSSVVDNYTFSFTSTYRDPTRTPDPAFIAGPAETEPMYIAFFGTGAPGGYSNINPYVYPTGFTHSVSWTDYPGRGSHYRDGYSRIVDVHSRVTSKYTSGRTGMTPLLIPANDCSSVYMGRLEAWSEFDFGGWNLHGYTYGYVEEWEYVHVPNTLRWDYVGLWTTPVIGQVNMYRLTSLGGTPITGAGLSSHYTYSTAISIQGKSFVANSGSGESAADIKCGIYHPSRLNPTLARRVGTLSSALLENYKYPVGTLVDPDNYVVDEYTTNIHLFIGAA